MVPQVVRNGPNTHVIIDTNPPINRPVGWSRSISTVGSVPPTGQHGQYRRSVRLLLRRITVDRFLVIDYSSTKTTSLSIKTDICQTFLIWILSELCGLPHYCALRVCVPDVIGGLAVWRHNKPKTQNQKRTAQRLSLRQNSWVCFSLWNLVSCFFDLK